MTQFILGNHIQLLRNGCEYFPELINAIESAKIDIYLQTYIYEADKIGIVVAESLKKAAQRGVIVKLLIDGFGSKNLKKTFVNDMQLAGVQVLFYRPKISPWSFKKSRLRRLHRKVVVIDSAIAFVGGINIIDDSNVPDNMSPRIDYAVRIQGALLPQISASVQKLWRRISFLHFKNTTLPSTDSTSNPNSNNINSANLGIKAAFVLRDNMLHRRDIEQAYLSAINQAKTEIIIANAYFVPGRKFRKALMQASERGVNVTLLLQGHMEYWLMLATHAFYSQFLKSNICIYEYRLGFMHSKVAVIDNHWATVGSSNIDPFSLLLAREANIVILDQPFAADLRDDILKSIHNGGVHIAQNNWEQGNKAKRFLSWLAYGFVRFILGIIGLSKLH